MNQNFSMPEFSSISRSADIRRRTSSDDMTHTKNRKCMRQSLFISAIRDFPFSIPVQAYLPARGSQYRHYVGVGMARCNGEKSLKRSLHQYFEKRG